MPVTKGAGNPDWTWDETLLTLDLLYRHGAPLDKKHPDVIALSVRLRSAAIHPAEARKESFRNPDGVALKMQNLQSAINPARRLSSSRTDRAVAAAYPPSEKEVVARVAAAILGELTLDRQIEDFPEDEQFIEGQVLTSSHRRRDRRLRRRLLDKCSDRGLVCQVCDFSPPHMPRDLMESFFEAHHVIPLSQSVGETSTRVRDMALLCAGCHRFVHRLIGRSKRWVDIAEARLAMGEHAI